jgi:tetratricopeptide (TPR) repeat protein
VPGGYPRLRQDARRKVQTFVVSRKSRDSKRKSQKRSRQQRPAGLSSDYRRCIHQADDILTQEAVEIRPDNWQQLALDWFAPQEPERGELARYIADHEHQLGIRWARELLRLEVFFQVEDYPQVIDHYDRAFSDYPRCALVEMWVADQVFRYAGDFWRARQMYLYAAAQLPDNAKPCYDLGFMSYLLGDFPGALGWFNQAAERMPDKNPEMAARILYNRGIVRYLVEGNRGAAIADVEEALKRMPDYPQAKEALRGLRGKLRWVPW